MRGGLGAVSFMSTSLSWLLSRRRKEVQMSQVVLTTRIIKHYLKSSLQPRLNRNIYDHILQSVGPQVNTRRIFP